MRLVRFLKESYIDFGYLCDDKIYPQRSHLEKNFKIYGDDLTVFINNDIAKEQLQNEYCIDASETVLLSPIKEPRRNVICVGKNYKEHVNEVKFLDKKIEIPNRPIYFTKLVDKFSDSDEINIKDLPTKRVDYEVELGIIISKDCKDVSKEEVRDNIFGYIVVNDISARDLQAERNQWFKGKSLDGFCPISKVIVTADEVEYPVRRKITSKVNNELRQSDYTDNLIFSIDEIISDLSRGMTIKAGDIILTGTPSGVGAGIGDGVFLQHGDICECEIEGIGKIVNKFI